MIFFFLLIICVACLRWYTISYTVTTFWWWPHKICASMCLKNLFTSTSKCLQIMSRREFGQTADTTQAIRAFGQRQRAQNTLHESKFHFPPTFSYSLLPPTPPRRHHLRWRWKTYKPAASTQSQDACIAVQFSIPTGCKTEYIQGKQWTKSEAFTTFFFSNK